MVGRGDRNTLAANGIAKRLRLERSRTPTGWTRAVLPAGCRRGWKPEGARLMSQILDGTTDSLIHLARVERETERQLRAALLRLGGYLDWDERAIIRFSEAITGRPGS